MIDTGSNISLIDSTELEKIQREGQLPIPVSYTHLPTYRRVGETQESDNTM